MLWHRTSLPDSRRPLECGVDPVRTIILPRVIALTIMTGLMDIVALSCGIGGG
ncbi:MAG: ABC transporter permease [Pseudonocardia sp.]